MNRVLAGAALAAFIVAMLTITIKSATSGGGSRVVTTTTIRTTTETQTTTAPTTTASVPLPQPVKLTAVGAYDPEGDQHENDDLAPLAVDGNPATAWKTEHYRHFSKHGVGLVLDAGKQRSISQVVVGTDVAGSSAQIELGDAPGGPFNAVSADLPLDGKTTFTLNKGSAGRYVVVWITGLPRAIGRHRVERPARGVAELDLRR